MDNFQFQTGAPKLIKVNFILNQREKLIDLSLERAVNLFKRESLTNRRKNDSQE